MNWTAQLNGREVSVTSERLAEYRSFYVSDSDLLTRMSELIWFDMYVYDQAFGVSTHEVMRSIHNLEAGEPHNGVKPATMFTRPPLRGLWHKHYFSSHFLVDNMLLGLGKNGVGKLVDEVMDPSKSNVVTREMLEELVHRVTYGTIEQRDAQGKLTGEWVIYAKNHGKNYYLCLNTHGAGDQVVYDRISQHCTRDFPNLLSWIANEAQAARP